MSKPHTVFAHDTTDGTLGEAIPESESGLSTSNTSNLKKCYPDSPIHKTTVVITIDGNTSTLSPSISSLAYKRTYYKNVMRGVSESIDFGTQDMSYGTSNIEGYSSKPPDYEDIWPEGESANAGFNGSTISKSGLGPNVSINPEIMADVKPKASQPTPMASSGKMTPAGTTITTKLDLGDSFAKDVASTIGSINSGQSSPVEP